MEKLEKIEIIKKGTDVYTMFGYAVLEEDIEVPIMPVRIVQKVVQKEVDVIASDEKIDNDKVGGSEEGQDKKEWKNDETDKKNDINAVEDKKEADNEITEKKESDNENPDKNNLEAIPLLPPATNNALETDNAKTPSEGPVLEKEELTKEIEQKPEDSEKKCEKLQEQKPEDLNNKDDQEAIKPKPEDLDKKPENPEQESESIENPKVFEKESKSTEMDEVPDEGKISDPHPIVTSTPQKPEATKEDTDSKPQVPTNPLTQTEALPVQTEEQFKKLESLYNEYMSSKIVKVKFKWGGYGFITAEQVKRKISLCIKSFFGQRENQTVIVPITYTISQVVNEYAKQSTIKASNMMNQKLYYPMGILQELNFTTHKLHHYKVPHMAKQILTAQLTFTWDKIRKSSGIKVIFFGDNLKKAEQ